MKLLHETEGPREATESRPAAGPAYRVHYAPKWPAQLKGNPQNLFESLQASIQKFPDQPALGWRPIDAEGNAEEYKYMTYAELDVQMSHIGSAIVGKGVTQGSSIGIYAANCPEWMITMKATDRTGNCCVPLYDTFGPDAVKFIIKHSQAKLLFVSAANIQGLTKVLADVSEQIVGVVVWGIDDNDDPRVEAARATGVEVDLWKTFAESGAANIVEPSPSGPEDLCTIMYTSGTTAEPKGVELTHRAVMATTAALITLIEYFHLSITEKDVFLSYLPLAHIFDRVAEEAFLAKGASIGYWQGDVKRLMDDIGALRPTIFVGVPRIFDRIYSGVTTKVSQSGMVGSALFNSSVTVKRGLMRLGISSIPLVDPLVFGEVKARLGGRVKVIVSGGAPLAKHVESFLKVTMCCPVAQGYGLTESCGASCVANPNKPGESGTVGLPVAGFEVRLEAVPDMGYDPMGKTPQGELIVRGETMFNKYHKREDLTSDAVDKDGWFHTGDVAEFTPTGALKIIDRLKNFFKLAHGEYVAAEKLENVFKKVTLVDQIWVYGDSERAQLVAIVVPSEPGLLAWAKSFGHDSSLEALCKNTAAAKHIQEQLEQSGRADGLKGFEIVKKVHLTMEPFSVDNDQMTPSFKLKRSQLKKAYQSTIDTMYSELD